MKSLKALYNKTFTDSNNGKSLIFESHVESLCQKAGRNTIL